MAEESFPSPGHNARQVTDSEHELLAARFSDDGIYGDPTDAQVVTAGTGLSVNIRADAAGSVRGHGWYSGSTPTAVALSANIASQPRVDWIVLRLDRADWTVRAAVVGGTPGSGAPALTQETGDTGVYEVPLAQARILGGASSVTVTRAEQYVGTRCRPCTSTTRNPYPRLGEQCFETDTGTARIWTGSEWKIVFDDTGDIDISRLTPAWSIGVTPVIERRNGIACLRLGSFERKIGQLAGGSESRLPAQIPVAFQHRNRDQYALAYIEGVSIGRITIYSKASDRPGQVWLVQKPTINPGDYVLTQSGPSWVVG
ncbi:hypothetical protein KBY55_09630 [Streptomyces sp. b94]|uniref:hypothetical protein n=1 Tax=Streptomyces sp. b94 TaxID=1827634 RepID=UPI001B367D1A|nr:hypothetical protein [Streptomyces sp. b94]MBQ1096344.1 hypothetical protein [Streptomyces sp. b94]